ncbi:hypothetical protein LCGC14_0565770 [marine sediment metagenome]|uniref:Uncharacterized protein n=1 Tax=marine sediment metagenome TaxID=412755 RepID=A0A0F9RKK3_9ZZZZ
MAYLYQTGTANDLPHWFSLLETFLVGRGWTVVSGTGTTTVVFSSPGEGGGRTKLFVRFFRHSTANRVYPRVQNDAAATQKTSESYYLDAPGLGAIPFEYWMAADKDKVIVNFKAGAAYTGFYVGVVEPFALTVEEEEQMVSLCLHEMDNVNCARVLKKHDGTWNQTVGGAYGVTNDYPRDPLDNSVAVFACRVGTESGVVGQPTDISYRIVTLAGINPEDTITTGYAGATSTWIIMGTGTLRWAMRTGGNVPVGQYEGAYFSHMNGLATSKEDFDAKMQVFMTAIGWTKIAHPSPGYPIEYYWYSQGESGVDDIYLHWYYYLNTRFRIRCADAVPSIHEGSISSLPIADGDFPTFYRVTGDRDCIAVSLQQVGIWNWIWIGRYQVYLPDPDSIDSAYMMGNEAYIFRDHYGQWDNSVGNNTLIKLSDGYQYSSPNAYDGVTNILWPYAVRQSTGKVPIGICKYIHLVNSGSLTIMDTIAIGGRSYRYLAEGSGYKIALRES